MAGLVEKNYAEALFELACAEGAQLQWQKELGMIDGILADHPEYGKLLSFPRLSAQERLGLVGQAFAGRVSDYIYNFLCLLTEKGRMRWFPGIYKAYAARCDAYYQVLEVVVTSSLPLTQAQRERLLAHMTKSTGKSVRMVERVDPGIIGGVVVKYGNTQIDNSIKTKINEMHDSLKSFMA